jgi:hypothetical protein
MKKSLFYFACIPLLIFSACKKQNIDYLHNQAQNPYFDSAVQYLKTQLTAQDFSKLNLENKEVLHYRGESIGIQIFEKNESPKKYIILKKDNTGYSGNWIDMSSLKLSKDSSYNGTVNIKSISEETQVILGVKNNKVIQVIKTSNTLVQTQVVNYPTYKRYNVYSREKEGTIELPDIVIYWGGKDQDYVSLYWLFNQDKKLEKCYYQGGGSSEATYGGGGGTGNNEDNVSIAPEFIPPADPITDIKKEVKCFTNNASSTYSISVNINQPSPGTRDVFSAFSNFRAGHTFLTLEQHNSDGTSIIRNIGFYPKYAAKPGDPLDVAVFGEDSNTPFDVSLKISVSGSDFITVTRNLENQTMVYDLNNFNCTNSAISALKSINVNLPSTKSASALFSGNNPGDLGEDIRNMDLNNFSASNGNRKMTRTVSSSNNQAAPKRNGGC